MVLARENENVNSGHTNGNAEEKKDMKDIMLVEYTGFVSLHVSCKQKQGVKYRCKILSLNSGRIIISLKRKKQKQKQIIRRKF